LKSGQDGRSISAALRPAPGRPRLPLPILPTYRPGTVESSLHPVELGPGIARRFLDADQKPPAPAAPNPDTIATIGAADMIRDLVLPITDTSGDGNALEMALALADYAKAHLAVVATIYLPAPVPGAWGVPPNAASMQRIHAETRAMAEAQAERLRDRLGRETVPSEVRLVETVAASPQHKVALHTRHADLAVMTSAHGDSLGERSAVRAFFSSQLLESGRPVLVVPPPCKVKMPPRHVVVAWRPTREASRALHDAMPLLRAAGSVDVLEIEADSEARTDDGALPGADIATHLARHDLRVRVVTKRGESVTTELLRHCEESGAQLLVAGGYGHSRFREWVLGGTTRELLQFAQVPVLFSH
jgi:nucleotide-binding universal stress UspA family protein